MTPTGLTNQADPSATEAKGRSRVTASPPSGLSIARGIQVVLQRWKILGAFTVVWLVVSVGAAIEFTKRTYQFQGVMVFTPIPIPQSHSEFDTGMTLKDLIPLMKLPDALAKIRDATQLPVPLKVIDQSVTFEFKSGTPTLKVSAKWDSEDQAKVLVDSAMKVFTERVAKLRKDKMQGFLQDVQNQKMLSFALVQKTRGRQEAFYRKYHLTNWKQDFARWNLEQQELKSALQKVRREKVSTQLQLDKMNTLIVDLKKEQKQEAAAEKQFQAAQETVADNRRRQDRLRELVEEERKRLDLTARLKIKKAELARLTPLYKDRLIKRSTYDKVTSEIIVIEAKLAENEKIRKFQEELKRIDKVVVPSGKKKSLGSPIIQQMLHSKLEIELKLIGIQSEIDQLTRAIQERSDLIVGLREAQKQHEAIQMTLSNAELEYQLLESKEGVIKQLSSMSVNELSVVQPAAPSPHPVSSNRKMLLVVIFGAGMSLFGGTILGYDLFLRARPAKDVLAELGLPALATYLGPKDTISDQHNQTVRLLANTLRQCLPEFGSRILVTPVGDNPPTTTLLVELAKCFGRREEKVLVLDLNHHLQLSGAFQPPVDHPDFQDRISRAEHLETKPDSLPTNQEPEDSSFPGDSQTKELIDHIRTIPNTPSVNFLKVGGDMDTCEQLVTQRMGEFMRQFVQIYSLIFLVGKPLSQLADVQIASGYADGVLFQISEKHVLTQEEIDAFDQLVKLEVPMLGSVVVRENP